jgi:hypothetical protein
LNDLVKLRPVNKVMPVKNALGPVYTAAAKLAMAAAA